MTTSVGSHLGSLGKGSQDLGETRDNPAGQRLVIDLAEYRSGAGYVAGGCPPFRAEPDQLIAQVLITRDVAHCDVDSFLKELMSLGVIV